MDMLIARLVVSGLIVLGGFLYVAPTPICIGYTACMAANR